MFNIKRFNKALIASAITLAMSTSSFAGNKESKHNSLTTYGDIGQIAIPVAAGFYSFYIGDYEGLGQLAEGAFYTAVMTHGLKYAVDAERPSGGSGSFPSGHTSSAMQGAAYLQFRYGWELGVPATAAAALVGYSRVEGNYHYWRDVVAGTALAWGTQYVITEMGFSPTGFMIAPFINDDAVGINATFQW